MQNGIQVTHGILILTLNQGYIFWPFSPHLGGGGGEFLSKLKNREEFEGGLHEKTKGKRGKRVIKHTLKYLYVA